MRIVPKNRKRVWGLSAHPGSQSMLTPNRHCGKKSDTGQGRGEGGRTGGRDCRIAGSADQVGLFPDGFILASGAPARRAEFAAVLEDKPATLALGRVHQESLGRPGASLNMIEMIQNLFQGQVQSGAKVCGPQSFAGQKIGYPLPGGHHRL